MQYFLVSGEMRSGTTFLANLLNSQDNMVMYSDSLNTLFKDANNYNIQNIRKPLKEFQLNAIINELIAIGRLYNLNLEGLKGTPLGDLYDILSYCLNTIAENEKKGATSFVGVKRTRERGLIKSLLDNGVKVVYCMRDPRDVILSSKNRFSGFSLNFTLRSWHESVDLCLRYKDHQNFHLIRYEDLMLNPEATLEKLAEFLNVEKIRSDFDSLKSHGDKKYIDNSSFGDVKKLFDTSGVYRFKSVKDTKTIDYVTVNSKRKLKLVGYDNSFNQGFGIGIKMRMQFALYLFTIHLKIFLRKIINRDN